MVLVALTSEYFFFKEDSCADEKKGALYGQLSLLHSSLFFVSIARALGGEKDVFLIMCLSFNPISMVVSA